MIFTMRRLMGAALLGVPVLSGCDSTPVDPYSDMRMLSPAEAGVKEQNQDPVLDAEKAQNAKFAGPEKKGR